MNTKFSAILVSLLCILTVSTLQMDLALTEKDRQTIFNYQEIRFDGKWKITHEHIPSESPYDLIKFFNNKEGRIRGYFAIERSDDDDYDDFDDEYMPELRIHEEKFNFHLTFFENDKDIRDNSVALTAYQGYRKKTSLDTHYIFKFQGESFLDQYEGIFRNHTQVALIELEANLTSLWNPEDSNPEITLILNIKDLEGATGNSENSQSYTLTAQMTPEDIPYWKDIFLMFFMIGIFIIKVKSFGGVFADFRMLGAWRKLSIITQIMILCSDLGVAGYYLNEVCDYERTSFLVGVFSIMIPPLTVMLDISLFANFVEMKWKYYFPSASNRHPPQRPDALKSLKFFLVSALVIFCGYHAGRYVLINYYESDGLKYLFALSFLPQILDNAFFQLLPYERISVILGNGASLLFIIYQKGVSQGPCYLPTSHDFCYIYLGLLLVQALILFVQIKYEYLVATNFFRFKLRKSHYLHDLEPDKSELECSICMGALGEDPLINLNDKPGMERLMKELRPKKGQIMKTPCEHRFHVLCLTQWLSNKLECPMCREKLDFVL